MLSIPYFYKYRIRRCQSNSKAAIDPRQPSPGPLGLLASRHDRRREILLISPAFSRKIGFHCLAARSKGIAMPWPTDITAMDKGRTLVVAFDDGQTIRLTA